MAQFLHLGLGRFDRWPCTRHRRAIQTTQTRHPQKDSCSHEPLPCSILPKPNKRVCFFPDPPPPCILQTHVQCVRVSGITAAMKYQTLSDTLQSNLEPDSAAYQKMIPLKTGLLRWAQRYKIGRSWKQKDAKQFLNRALVDCSEKP